VSEVRRDAIQSGETYRIVVLELGHTPLRSDTQSSDTSSEMAVTPQETGPPKPPVEEGEIRDVMVETVGDQGDGIARTDRGYAVIVPEAKPGDEPTVEIEQLVSLVSVSRVAWLRVTCSTTV